MPERADERLRRMFGEVLPDTTTDDRPDEADDSDQHDQWLRDNRPPHHDGPV